MLRYTTTTRFERDLNLQYKQGKEIAKLYDVMKQLIAEQPLEKKYRNHKLRGSYQGHWECHIEPDWLLIYYKTSTEITFVRTGSHSHLLE